jgi:hypothetical protein
VTRGFWQTERLLRAAAAFLILAGVLAGAARAQLQTPDAVQAVYMVKTTLVALNHANLTGNYTVLRDLGSLRFRANNNAARLAAVFARLRDEGIDLAPVVVFDPQFAVPPGLDEEGRLRLVGQFPTRPLRVVFDIAYELTGNGWSISDLSVNTVPWPDGADDEDEERGSTSQPAPPQPGPAQSAPARQFQLPIPQPRPVQLQTP